MTCLSDYTCQFRFSQKDNARTALTFTQGLDVGPPTFYSDLQAKKGPHTEVALSRHRFGITWIPAYP